MTGELSRTALCDWHQEHGARMVDFAGWLMPVQYTSIVDEHKATRAAAGLFDISHMGRLRFDGAGAAALLDRLLTRRVTDMQVGQIRYSLVTNESGGILDDVLVYHLEKPSGARYHLLVVNASNREKIVNWIGQQLRPDDDVQILDRTLDTAMIAVQGPEAVAIVDSLVGCDVAKLGYYTGVVTQQMRKPCIVSRTGYTGEDGCELIVKSDEALQVWQNLLLAGRGKIVPAGLGARDTLRLEAGMPLYGHELDERIDPFTAGLRFAVNLKGRQFVGSEALARVEHDTARPKRIGLELLSRRVPREQYDVLRGSERVGQVTSGTFSPTLEKPIAMAYVRPEASQVGTELQVDVRGKLEPARVVSLPFYSRTQPGGSAARKEKNPS